MTNIIDCHPSATGPDLNALKVKQQAAWSSGDYAVIGTTLQIVGEQLAESMDLRAGDKVLDVAAGNGNVTLAAARRWCEVTCTDYVEALLGRARARATAEGLEVRFEVADAENLPFADGAFDAVVSTFGGMFSPNQDRTAAQMVRVTRPGGKIGLANWTPEGFIGQLFKTIGKHLPPPQGVKSPAVWGTRSFLDASFGDSASAIATTPRHFVFRYRSAEHFLDVFRTFYGPVLKAFEALEGRDQKALSHDILELVGRLNVSGDRSMVVPSEYLEVIITKR
ncbi:class I SAM-dependent methyltransferase [Bradyrhizobium manausense]|uniref:class I SAM-dependent methyltransferase n=1 Tax=Bradyrhizobium manausense TaxID=989370 RepID=UPI001BAA6C86|nr:class I SAM-dependent methyltransferase [Bradyrhizobium manausense]MBR1091084.1 class I SAM-dependent methyltransferase [Bradyrhizobium manausense]